MTVPTTDPSLSRTATRYVTASELTWLSQITSTRAGTMPHRTYTRFISLASSRDFNGRTVIPVGVQSSGSSENRNR